MIHVKALLHDFKRRQPELRRGTYGKVVSLRGTWWLMQAERESQRQGHGLSPEEPGPRAPREEVLGGGGMGGPQKSSMFQATQNFMSVPFPPLGMTHALSSTLPTPRSMASSSGMDAATLAYLGVCSLVVTTCVCGIVGNGLVVWLLSCRAHRSPFHVYVLNLAVADLLFLLCMAALVGLETQPLAELNRDSHEVEVIKAYEVLSRTKYFAYTAGLSLLTAISTQRCVSVLFPIWYKCHQPRHLSAVVCAVLWALSLLMNTLASFFCSWFWNPQKQQCFKVDMVFGVLIIGVFVPVMTLSSAILYVRVRRSSLLQRQRPRRLFVVILVSVLVFLVCSLPLGLYWFVLYWVGLPREVWLLYTSLSRLSSSIGSSANPVIYFLVGSQRSRGLQESLGAVLGRALREEPELEGRETPSTATNEGI